jgi:hypothetical protein
MHHVTRVTVSQQRLERLAQFRGSPPAPVGKVLFEGAVQRTGYVAGHPVDGFDLAQVARAGTGIHQHGVVLRHQVGKFVGIHEQVGIEGDIHVGVRGFRDIGGQGLPRRCPGLDPAIEHGGRDARHHQQPPQARRRQCAACPVVGHHVPARQPAPRRQARGKLGGRRQRMPARVLSTRAMIGKVAIKMGVDRAGQVPSPVGGLARFRVGKLEAAVNEEGALQACRGAGIDYGCNAHACPIRRSRFNTMAAVAPQMRWPAWTNSTMSRRWPR